MVDIDILTIFPAMFEPVLNESIIKRALRKRAVRITARNLRDFSSDKHRKVDDRPFGGGPGMVMRPEPIFAAVKKIAPESKRSTRIILLTPQGKKFDQIMARKLSKMKHLVLICGHYEGVDERVRKHLATDEISIGDFVLTGGELPAMVIIDAVVRLIPGVLGDADSAKDDSFSKNLLEYPHYTRPADFRGMRVPEILLSGDHKKIEEWRKKEAQKRTKQRRPDMLS